MKKRLRDTKAVSILLIVMAVIVLAYVAQDVYFSWSGNLRTEYLFLTTERENISVRGIVIRDENRTVDGASVSLLKMQADEIYIPSVTDSTSVAAGDIIAYAFKSETQAQLYHDHMTVEAKIEALQTLQEQQNLTYIDRVALNSEILSALDQYMQRIDSNHLFDLPEAMQTVDYKLTTRQISDPDSLVDFSAQLSALEEEKLSLEKQMTAPRLVTTPYAGYFVSDTDGYESAFDYAALQKDSVTPQQVESLMKTLPRSSSGTFGKIIGQHTWYYLCNVPVSEIGSLSKGKYVSVSFPEKGIYDVAMRVHSVSDRGSENVALVLKCTSMNEALSTLRKERAEITINTYDGYRIDSSALYEKDGLTGVYVLSGKVAVFKPITVLYDASSYVVATTYRPKTTDALQGETQDTPNYPKLETFDQVIIDGRNLYDGKVIS